MVRIMMFDRHGGIIDRPILSGMNGRNIAVRSPIENAVDSLRHSRRLLREHLQMGCDLLCHVSSFPQSTELYIEFERYNL